MVRNSDLRDAILNALGGYNRRPEVHLYPGTCSQFIQYPFHGFRIKHGKHTTMPERWRDGTSLFKQGDHFFTNATDYCTRAFI